MTTRALVLAALAAAATVPGVAGAGPDRRDRPDADEAAEARSVLWGELAHPGGADARGKLDDALRLMRLRTGDLASAVALLTDVTTALPDQADGFGYLAIAAENLRRWPACASAYAATRALDPAWRPLRLLETRPIRLQGVTRALPLSIAFCQGRAGDLAGAAATLAAAVARGESSNELWLRTGEIAMAQGRLDDAIAALERAGGEGPARWLLAMAHDRARHDDDADAATENAHRYDPRAGAAGWSAVPLIAGDNDYLLGLAEAHPERPELSGRPELAIAYFRRFLRSAPAASPWRARALAHLDALAAVDLDTRIAVDGDGVTAAERATIVARVKKLRPALAACMAPVPTRVEELALTVASVIPLKPMPWPRRASAGKPPGPPPPRVVVPLPDPPRIAVTPLPMPLRADEDRDAVERAEACLTAVGTRLTLPATAGLHVVRIPVVAR